jgi:hypothetical protein
MSVSKSKIAAMAVALAVPAQALALAHGALTFDQPTGTVAGDQSIPVWLSFTLDQDSDALITDAGLVTSGGPDDQQLLDKGVDLDRPYSLSLTVSFTCSGTFTQGGCTTDGTPYTFDFNYSPPSFIGGNSYSIQPGETLANIHYGTFQPIGGNAPAGTYSFYQASLLINVYQESGEQDGQPLFQTFEIGTTCPYDGSGCSFTREVTPVPEPGEWAMMAGGLGIAAAFARRRRN